MNLLRTMTWLSGLALLLCGGAARAADIDLFTGGTPTGTNAPAVLFVIDTGASFSAANAGFRCNIDSAGNVKVNGEGNTGDFTKLDQTNGGVEQCALYTVLKSLEASTSTIQVGVMFFNSGMKTYDPVADTFGSDCTSGDGGCLAVPMTGLDTTTGPRIREWIRRWEISGNNNYLIKAPANRGDGAAMQEAWAYFYGKTGVSGRDYSKTPFPPGCGAKHIIYLGNNWNTQASPKDATNESGSPLKRLNGTSLSLLSRADPTATVDQLKPIQYSDAPNCGTGTAATLDNAEGKGAYALNWARYMKDLGVTTWSVALMNKATCDVQYGLFLKHMGSQSIGGGAFFNANNYDELIKALKIAFSNIASVNSVFAAVSLPVSVNQQGSYLNQIYIGMFRPAKSFLPRWTGNLKQYKLEKVDQQLRLQDADSQNAINSLTGFIGECARSFWTPKTVDTYWEKDQNGGCLAVADSKKSNSPDGNIVEKGAQAYRLRLPTPASRTVTTCSPVFSNCSALTNFSADNSAITTALLDTTDAERTNLINWARGANLDAELEKTTGEMRPSAHGDVVHSRPIPVNYGTDKAPSVVIFYGGNDGMLRAVNGNRGADADSTVGEIVSGGKTFKAGDELWSFVPPEFWGNFAALRRNDTPISAPATTANASNGKRYGIDGPITAFQGDISGTRKTFVYSTMRRGGHAIYAFDVTQPGAPSLLWKKGCPTAAAGDTGCSTGYSSAAGRIGQTWSSLKPMRATGVGAGATPLLIMGGGYDTCDDWDGGASGANHNCGATPNGNKVYVLNAETGAVVKAFDTVRSVIADATIVRDSTGMAKYAYTADMGGNVYRLTFDGAPSAWTLKKIASVGCDTLGTCTSPRKFMFQPSVVNVDDTYYIMLGSGDREKPLEFYGAATAVKNYFFMIKDRPSDSNWTVDTGNCGTGTDTLCRNSLYPILDASTPTADQLKTKKGWYLGLRPKEQVVTASITIFGVVTFSTHEPTNVATANMCKPQLGETRVYNISYLDAKSANGTDSRDEDVSGDGLPPSPVGGQVLLDSGEQVGFCIGCSKSSPLEGALPRTLTPVIKPKSRLYWYIQK